MKKRWTALLCMLLVVFSLMLPAAAQGEKLYVTDETDNLGKTEEALNLRAEELSEELGANVVFRMITTSNGDLAGFAYRSYHDAFGDADGVMLVLSLEESLWRIDGFGALELQITDEDADAMWNAFWDEEYYDDCVDAYLSEAEKVLMAKGYGAAETRPTQNGGLWGRGGVTKPDDEAEAVGVSTAAGMSEAAGETEAAGTSEAAEGAGESAAEVGTGKETGETAGVPEIPAERQFPRLVDEADLLTEEEEEELLQRLDEISERQKCDVAIVTVDSMGGKTAEAFADDFYDYNGYGYGPDDDGILLLLSMEDRDWAITTYGFGIPAFTDEGQEYMVDHFMPLISDGDYADGFSKFADLCDEFLTQARTGEPYDIGNMPKGTVHWIWLPIDIVIGLLVGLVVGKKKMGSLKSVVRKDTANPYAVQESFHLFRQSDMLVNSVVTRNKIVKESSKSSSGGGSSTHTSSSGRSHGGSSGKF